MNSRIKRILISFAIVMIAVLSLNKTDVYAASKKFNVTFLYGNKISAQQVAQGKNAIVPTDVAVPGFVFAGWTDTAANIQCDKLILGVYTPTVQSIKPTPVQQTNINAPIKYNNDVSAPGEPWWDYSLKGTPGKTCVVRWYNGHSGELWKTEVVPYGATLDDPANPCLDHMDFVGWIGSWKNITEDRNIEACYYHKNKVQFIDPFDGEFNTQWVRDHMGASEPSIPTHHGYHFVKFSESLSDVTCDRDIYLIYEKDKKDDDED